MGRSISTPRGATTVIYAAFDADDDGTEFEDDYAIAWDAAINCLQSECMHAAPSLTPCDHWLDREDHAILENRLAYIGVSEYCGCVAVWAVPKEEHPELSAAWCAKIAPALAKSVRCAFGNTMQRMGIASNGEAFYSIA